MLVRLCFLVSLLFCVLVPESAVFCNGEAEHNTSKTLSWFPTAAVFGYKIVPLQACLGREAQSGRGKARANSPASADRQKKVLKRPPNQTILEYA